MSPRYVVESDAILPLSAGDAFKVAGFAVVMRVVQSIRNNRAAVLETSLTADEAEGILQKMRDRGLISDWREEYSGYVPLGTVYPTGAEGTIRAQFPVCGVPKDTLVDMTLGIADTGTPPVAAQQGPLSEYEITSIDGQLDTVGHATGVASCTFAARLAFAQALPGGMGSESSIAGAIQALADAGVGMINLSLGFPGENPPRSSIIDAAVGYAEDQKGIPCGAAAGNSGWAAKIGSPQAVCAFVWGATTLDGKSSASFSSGGSNWPQETGALPGQQVGVAHLDGGYGVADGTSFSAPFGCSIALAVAEADGDWHDVQGLLVSGQAPLSPQRLRGLVQVEAYEIGVGVPPPEDDVVDDQTWRDNINGIADEVWRIVDSAQQTGWEAEQTTSALGSIKDYQAQIKHWVTQAPPKA